MSNQYFNAGENRQALATITDSLYDCVDSVTKDALLIVAFQGGYYNKPTTSFSYDPVFFPYYYYEGKTTVPSLETIETEMAAYVSDNMAECVEEIDYTTFTSDYSAPHTTVEITKDNAQFIVNMPIEIQSEGHTTVVELEEYKKNYNSSLFDIHEVAAFIALSHEEDPEDYCVSCVTEMAQERDLYVYIYPSVGNEHITTIMIYENRTGIGNPYTFVFFNKYTGEEQTPKLQSV